MLSYIDTFTHSFPKEKVYQQYSNPTFIHCISSLDINKELHSRKHMILQMMNTTLWFIILIYIYYTMSNYLVSFCAGMDITILDHIRCLYRERWTEPCTARQLFNSFWHHSNNRKVELFQQDNTCSHAFRVTQQHIRQLTPINHAWTGWNDDWLVQLLHLKPLLFYVKMSKWLRIKCHKIVITFCKCKCIYMWSEYCWHALCFRTRLFIELYMLCLL